jgi:hypothetical protein
MKTFKNTKIIATFTTLSFVLAKNFSTTAYFFQSNAKKTWELINLAIKRKKKKNLLLA